MRHLRDPGAVPTLPLRRPQALESVRRGFQRAVPICLLALTSGCSAYLHNPERASATADLKTKFDKMTAPAFFDAQEKNLADLSQQEDRAVAELLVTSRDYRLLNVVTPATTSGEESPGERLAGIIETDLQRSYGKGYLSTDEITSTETRPFIAATAAQNIDFKRTAAADIGLMYKGAGGSLKTDCKSVLAGPPPADFPNEDQARYYQGLVTACRSLHAAEDTLKPCTRGATAGDLRTLCIEGGRLDEVAALRAKKSELEAAQKALREAMKAKISDEAAAIEAADKLIADAQKLPEDEGLKTVLTHIETIFSEQLATTINGLVTDADAAAGKAAEPIMAALEALGAAYEIRDRSRAKASEQASALLVGLAKIRHDLNLVEIDIATRKTEREIVDQQTEALGRQLYYLAQAQDSLCNPGGVKCTPKADPQAQAEAVSFYLRSMNVGRGPYEILSFRRAQVQRAAALKRARTTEEDYRRLVQPAIDQIAAYGAGGVKPETVANLLSGLALLAE